MDNQINFKYFAVKVIFQLTLFNIF